MNDILVGRAAYEAELANALDHVAKVTARRRELESALGTMIMPRESAGVSVSNERDTGEGQSQRGSLRATLRLLRREERRSNREIRTLRALCAAF